MEKQANVAEYYPPEMQPFAEHMEQIREYINIAGEFSIAYESIVASLETLPFSLTGKESVALLELGLIMRYKTTDEQDRIYDSSY